mmetsp:Transcript_32197/g.75720  ORF Transcript_32197/g.75720 Transcript_32197/m.75720 type:complete len:213 (-) Transcript_32197:67-705(-)
MSGNPRDLVDSNILEGSGKFFNLSKSNPLSLTTPEPIAAPTAMADAPPTKGVKNLFFFSFSVEPSGADPEDSETGMVARPLLATYSFKTRSWEAVGADLRGWVARTGVSSPFAPGMLTPGTVALGVPSRSGLMFVSLSLLLPLSSGAAGVPNRYRLPETVRTVDSSFNPVCFFRGLVSTLSPLSAMTPWMRPSGKSFHELITPMSLPLAVAA